jgi:hypothetical protein
MYILPVSALIVQNNAWAPSLCLLFRRMLYFQFLFLLFRRYITHSFCSYCSELYACTYFQFLLLLFIAMHVRSSSFCPYCSERCITPSLCSCCSELCMHICTSSFCPYCSEGCMSSRSLLLLFREMHYSSFCSCFLSVSFLIIHSYACTYFKFLLLLF